MLLALLVHVCIYCTDRGIVRSYQKYLPETYKRFKGEKVKLGREAGAVSRLVTCKKKWFLLSSIWDSVQQSHPPRVSILLL